ncbi:MAG: InlB B-repeat-containing protein [Treponema succinifaciens]|nr:MAG: InlB B-repeat-containing protein [Treponema succinifaciens]
MTGDDSKTTEYKLSFSANGGTGEMESITKEENEKINLPAVKFSRTGFEFLNWNTVADGSGTSYTDGAEFTFNTDTTLHAQWKEKKATPSNPETPENPTQPEQPQNPEIPSTPKTTYTVTFDANGGSGTIANISVEEGSEITLPKNTFTKSSYIFAGWATSADGDVSYSDKAKITVTGNTTLYAKWTAITYTITYEPNGGTNADGNPASYTFETETITLLAPSRQYFDFGGWYTDSEFSDSSKKNEITKGSTGNIMLYAKWTVAAENAVNAINSLPTGEHKIAVTGQMTKDNLNGVIAAIKGNSNGAKVYLDLGGTAIVFYDWQSCKFADCENLIGIVIPTIESPDKNNPIILIPDLMFEGCKNLKTVIILNSSDEYKIITFKDCTSLEYVEIPTSIVCIYGDAFDGCTALETITYKGTVEQWKQVKTDYKKENYKLMSLNVQCENGTASGSDLIKE